MSHRLEYLVFTWSYLTENYKNHRSENKDVMTSVKPIPDGYHRVTAYILVQGADKLIDFIKKAFDAKETERYLMPDGTIGHAEVRLGDSIIMISDAQGEEYKAMAAGIHLYVEDCDAIYKRALEAGATSIMEPADQFYGDRSAGVKDQFGNRWWIATHKEDLSKDEIARRMDDAMKHHQEKQNEH
jgi:PhnB protein